MDNEGRASLKEALHYIRDVPFEHGHMVTRRMMEPVMMYMYNDENWRIAYTLSKVPGELTYIIV